MAARSSLLRRPTPGARPARRTSSVVAALAALAPRLVRLARHDYPDGLLASGLRGLAGVIATVGTVCSARVTHEELRPLLAGYAAGTLDEAGCEAVRVHLAGGCVACLRDVFDRPVGLPRTPP